MVSITLVPGCRDLEVENLNAPDIDRVLNTPGDLISFLEAGHLNALRGHTSLWQTGIYGMADGLTSTNRYIDFWGYTEEPRQRHNNTADYNGINHNYAQWFYNNQAAYAGNAVLQYIADNGALVVDEEDRTDDARAGALFIKGLGQAHLGVYFDQAYIVNYDSDPSNVALSSYVDVLNEGIKNIEEAVSVANGASNFNYNFIPGVEMDAAQFTEMANMYMARLLAGMPRTRAEAEGLGADHWNRVLTYAQNGPKSIFPYLSTNLLFFSHIDWGTYALSTGAGYLPVDIKIPHLVDNTGTYPDYYPANILDPVQTDDQRFAQYYEYALDANGNADFGYLNPDRNRGLFSNYKHVRYWNQNDQSQVGVENPWMLPSEMTYLQAEAQIFLGNPNAAIALLNASPRIADGGLPAVTAADDLKSILHWEYAIELDYGVPAVGHWAFMRRHDLLIQGTMTEFPIPAPELEATGKELYSYGGKGFAGETGPNGEVATATGVGAWKESE